MTICFFLNMCVATRNSTMKNFTCKWQFQRVEIIAIGESAGVKNRLRTADCGPGVKCRLQTESKTQAGCKMQNEDC